MANYKQFKKLHVPEHWEHYWSKYPQGYTIMEALISWVSQVDHMVDNVNDWNAYLAQFVETFDTKLQDNVRDMVQELYDNGELSELTAQVIDVVQNQIDDVKSDLNSRGVNLLSLGAKMDGSDETVLLQNALNTYRSVILPRGVIGVSRTIVVPSNSQLVGAIDYINQNVMNTPTIRWVGDVDRMKTVIRIGGNNVGDEPVVDSSRIIVSNILIDGNDLAGFGMYGTYVTNETQITNVKVVNTLEYGFYFAKSWYAYFDKLYAQNNKGNGMAFALPLKLSNGLEFNWTTQAPLEINAVTISNLRCHNNGTDFTAQNLYSPFDENIRARGYGLGIGRSNGLFVNNVTAESNGGAGVYLRLDNTVVANLQNFYLENNARHAGLDPASTRTNLLIESAGTSSGIVLESWFMNYTSGGIHHFGNLSSKILLRSFYQPRFIKSLDGHSNTELRSAITGQGLFYMGGEYNFDDTLTTGCSGYGVINARYTQNIDVLPSPSNQLIRLRLVDPSSVPAGSIIVKRSDGTQNSYGLSNLTGEWWYLQGRNVVMVQSSGGGSADFEVEIQVLDSTRIIHY